MNEIDKFRKAFLAVKKKGEYKSKRSGNTGIGKTLEDAFGIIENNIDAPDLHGYEIKSKRALSESKLTLFTKVATYPEAINTRLRLKYGSKDPEFPDIKVLHTSMDAKRWNTHISGFSYTLKRDDKNKKLFMRVKKISSRKIVENNIYWDYDILKNTIQKKLNKLAFVIADTRKVKQQEYFTFNQCKLYYDFDLDNFLEHISNGNINLEIRIGAYKNKSNSKTYGTTHDHGNAFRIEKNMLNILYKKSEIIE